MKQILQSLGFSLEKIVHANGADISEDVKSFKINLSSDIWRTGLKIAELKLNGRYTFVDFNQGVTLSMIATDEVSQQYDWGTFYLVDKSHLEYSDHMDETVITLHDGMIKAHQEFLASDLGITFPCTIDTLINAIGDYMGLSVSGTWLNGTHEIEENKWENNGLTYRDALDDIAFVTNTTIGVFNDVLVFKPVDKTVVDTIDGGELSLTHEAKWGKPNVLNLTREPQHDNYAFPTDFTEIPKDDRVELVIENNQIIDKRREELAPTLFSQIQNVEYTPFEYTGFGYLTMDYGDYVGFKDKDNNLQYGYVTKLEWQVGSGFTEMLGCELTTRAKEDYVLNTDQRRLGLQTYFLVDQQNGIIEGMIERVEDNEESIRQILLDNEGFLVRVEDIETEIKDIELTPGPPGPPGPPGGDGVGITGTVVKYQLSNQGTVTPTGTWHNTVPNLTQSMYLWTRTTTSYTQGSDTHSYSVSYIAVDGTNGKDGNDGKATYTWIRYADTANGGGISNSPTGKDYIGLAHNKDTATESDTPSDYTWSLIRGEQGNQGVEGPKGDDGVTTYTWIKYSPNADGSDLTDAPQANTAYIGIATNKTTPDESNTPSDYTWSLFKGPKGDTGYTPIKGVDYFDGIDGQDGKGIISAVVTYQNHTNGTTAPTGTWTENPSPIKGQYLWTRTITTYTDTTSVPTYSVAYQAIDGSSGTDGRGISSTVVDYVKSTTAAMPSSGWSTTRPTVNKGEYLWTRTTINYTSGSPSVSISNSYVPTDGQNGTSAYLWVRYSQNANGNPMTTSPTNAKYIGVATTSTRTAPSEYNLYTWSLIKGEDGVPGETGQDGKTSYLHIKYSNDGGTTFTSNNGETVGDWIGTYVDFIEADSPNVSSYTWNKVKGAKGDKGDKGDQGKGILSTVVTYQAGSSGTITPTGNWSATVPTVSENQYLWTRTIITYTDNKTSTAYSVGKIGAQGPKGDTGTDGKGISSTTVTYQASTSGTVTPTGTWQTTVPSVAENQYLWTRIVINYTSGSPTTSYSIGKMGAQGPQGAKGDKGETGLRGATGEKGPKGDTGTSVSSVDEYYLATNLSSGVTTSTSGWKTTMQPMTTTNKYLWNYEVINFSDGSSSPTIPVIIGVHGSTGATGRALTGVTEYYLASASASGVTRPATDGTSGWTTTMQTTSTTKPYLWNYEKLTWSVAPTTSYIEPIIIGIHGATGGQGPKGDKGEQGPQGIQGPAGTNGQSQYVHIRYSANANGNPLQTSPQTTTKYIGIANTTSSTAPSGYASYTWSKYVGDDGSQGPQGIQGPAGANGQPTYTWVKYADTPTSGMDDFPDGKKYIGLAFNKPTATESNNYSDYAWSLVKGENGIDGRSVDDIVTEFYLSTSKTSQSGGVWQVMMPTWQTGKYLWTRLKIDYINPVSTEYTTPEIDASWEAMDGLENEIIRVETQTTAKIEANTDAIDLEKTTRITQYGTLNDSIQENAGKINVLDNKVNIEVLEEIDGMRSKTSQIETELTNIEAKIEGISFGSIGINSTLEDDTYDFWESAVTNDPLEFNTGMMFRTGMDNYTIFEPFEDPSLLSPFGMSFFANGSQENGPFAVFNDYKYGYRIRRFSGNQPFTLEIKEYNGSKTYLRKQTYNFNTVQSYHDISNIEFGNDVEFIGLNYIVSGVSWTNRLQLAETMFGIGAPKPYVENVDGVRAWAQAQLQMQQAQIDLKVATKDFTGERMVSLINVQPANIKIASKNLDLQGLVNFTNLTDGRTTISGSNITTGTINANNVSVTNLRASSITSGTLDPVRIPNLDASKITTGRLSSDRINFNNATGTNVNLTGTITATSGKIAGFTISGNNLVGTDISLKPKEIGIGSSRLWTTGEVSGTIVAETGSLNISPNTNYAGYATLHLGNYTGISRDVKFGITGTTAYIDYMRPTDKASDIGNPTGTGLRYRYIYLQNQPNVSSDLRHKFAIQDIPSDLIERLSEIKPKMYLQGTKWNFGYIAQDVERALYLWATKRYGREAKYYVDKFAMLHKSESHLSLLYGELAVLKEQQMMNEITKLNRRLELLENERH